MTKNFLIALLLAGFIASCLCISAENPEISSQETEKLTKIFRDFSNADADTKARFLISGLLDSSMKGNWNKTFVNSVNASNFKYDTILQGFDSLVSAAFDFSESDLVKIENGTKTIAFALLDFINSVFYFTRNSSTSYSYGAILDTLNTVVSQYNFSNFVNQTQCLLNSKYDLHAILLQIKWWARKDLHKAGLLWGKFDLNMSDCLADQEYIYLTTATYTSSQKFFFGQVSAKLNKNWTVAIVDSVSDSNYNFNSILSSLDVIAKNIENRDPVAWTQAIQNISVVLDSLIQALFPKNHVVSNEINVFDLLNKTRALYSNVDRFTEQVDKVQSYFNLTDFIENKLLASINKGLQKDFSSAGYLWEKMNQMLLPNTSVAADVDRDMKTKMFVSGFLDQTLQGNWNKTFLKTLNYTSFPYDIVVSSLSLLSTVNFTSQISSVDLNKISNATKELSNAFNLLLNMSFPLHNGQRVISPSYNRIFEQLNLSSKNYQVEPFVFLNKTLYLDISPLQFHNLLLTFRWNAQRDLHRAGLIWGLIDSNLTNSSYPVGTPSVNAADEMAHKFFFGYTASKLGKSWNRSIIDQVTKDPFDYESIVNYLSIINNNIYDRCYLDWRYAVYGIYYILDDTITALFPGDVVPENYTNIYQHLNDTRALYSDLDVFSAYVDSVKDSMNLTDFLGRKVMYSIRRDNSSTGFLWGMFNQIITNGTLRTNVSAIKNKEFLKGMVGKEIPKNVDMLEILEELKRGVRHNSHEEGRSIKKTMFKIADIVSQGIDSMFPLVGYGYRYGIEMRAVPEEYKEVYEKLKLIRDVCTDYRGVKRFLKDNKEILKRMVVDILETQSYEMKGKKFMSLFEFLGKNAKRSHEFLGL